MKKLLLLPLLITLSTTILAKTPESLFGVYINDNVLDYVTQKELKSKSRDYVRGFYGLILKNPPVSNKDFSDMLFVKFDKNNKIAEIKSQKKFQNSETCEKVEYGIRRTLETKYNIEFVRNSRAKYGFQKLFIDNGISTQCKVFSDDDITLFISLETTEYYEKYKEYFNSQI